MYMYLFLLIIISQFCSVIGAVVICVGFYAVIWGKANEEEINDDNDSRDSKTPLLQSQKTGDTEV